MPQTWTLYPVNNGDDTMQETALIRHRSGAAAVAISQEHAGIVPGYMEQSLAENTRRAYKSE